MNVIPALALSLCLLLSACGDGAPSGLSAASPAPAGDTAAFAAPALHEKQTLFLWEKGSVPAVTEYADNAGNYFDAPDFRPTLTFFPVPEGTNVKGAVLICAGRAFQDGGKLK